MVSSLSYLKDKWVAFLFCWGKNYFLAYCDLNYPNIHFTFQVVKNNCMALLDIEIFCTRDKFEWPVHRKWSFYDIYINYTSFIPKERKENTVSVLLYRSFTTGLHFMMMSRLRNWQIWIARMEFTASRHHNIPFKLTFKVNFF